MEGNGRRGLTCAPEALLLGSACRTIGLPCWLAGRSLSSASQTRPGRDALLAGISIDDDTVRALWHGAP
jgi:hypothetical protein|eukprot:COSAG01_NODE_570_length_15328_cov_82.520783_16_plen_69_part_00